MKEEKSLPTLGEFIIEKQRDFKYSTGELSRLISCIQIASKMVNRAINKAGIANILGAAGNENVQGEEQQKLDVIANETFIKSLSQREVVCGIASEENDTFLKEIPLEHLVLETDAPYLAPVPFRGKRNESSYLIYIVKKLAEIYNISENEIIKRTTNNALEIFKP